MRTNLILMTFFSVVLLRLYITNGNQSYLSYSYLHSIENGEEFFSTLLTERAEYVFIVCSSSSPILLVRFAVPMKKNRMKTEKQRENQQVRRINRNQLISFDFIRFGLLSKVVVSRISSSSSSSSFSSDN